MVLRSRKFEGKVWDLSTKTDDGKLEELFVVISGNRFFILQFQEEIENRRSLNDHPFGKAGQIH